MSTNPFVTIMIPTYNQSEYLQQAIESALNQTYGNLEIIVSDDSSTDKGVVSILNKFQDNDKVRIFQNEVNLGRVKNYHTSLYERAKGEWVINLDGDDVFEDRTFIEQAMELIAGEPELVMVSGTTVEMSATSEKINRANRGEFKILSSETAYTNFLEGKYFPFHGATLYNRKQALAVGFYLHDIISTDLESFLRLMQTGLVGVIGSIVLKHRSHDSNASYNMSVDDFIENIVVFSAPLRLSENVSSLVEKTILKNWVRRFAFRKGKDNAYRILKQLHSNKGYLHYLREIWEMDKMVALSIFVQPKNILKMIRNISN